MPYLAICFHNYLRNCPSLSLSLRQPKTTMTATTASLWLCRRFHFCPNNNTLIRLHPPPLESHRIAVSFSVTVGLRNCRLRSAFAATCSAASSGLCSTLVFKRQSNASSPYFYHQNSRYGRLAYDDYDSEEDSDRESQSRQLCASTLDNIEEWKWKLTMLMRNKDEQEVVSRERKDRRDFDQLSALATRMGLYIRQYAKVVVISKVPLPNYRSDLDDRRPQREVVLPFGLRREVDARLKGYISRKSVTKENFSDGNFSSSSCASSLHTDERVSEQEEPLMRNNIVSERILRRKSLQLRNKQQDWQVVLLKNLPDRFAEKFTSSLFRTVSLGGDTILLFYY